MDVSIPFYKFKKTIEKEEEEDSFDFKYLILGQIETFKKMVKDYIIEKCNTCRIIDMERENKTVEEAKEKYDIIFNPFYKVKVIDRYEIKIKTDMLIKTELLERIFESKTSNEIQKNFVHINILYKTISINKKGHALLSKYEKLNQTLLHLATGDSSTIYIGRKYKTKNEIVDNCFGLCALTEGKNHEDNFGELELILNNKGYKSDVTKEINNTKLDNISPIEYKRKFKFELKKGFNIENSDVHKVADKTIFLDFEFIPDLIGNFDTFPKTTRKSIVFMIGIGYLENREWVYKEYTTRELSEEDETRIMNNWLKDMKILNQNGYKYIMHWSTAEKTYLSKSIIGNLENGFTFIDLMQVFKKCQTEHLKYKSLSLKHVSNIFNTFKLVDLKWDDNMPNGKTAMIETLFCNLNLQNKKRRKEKKLIDFDIIKTVVKYNEIDVKIMFLILSKMTK